MKEAKFVEYPDNLVGDVRHQLSEHAVKNENRQQQQQQRRQIEQGRAPPSFLEELLALRIDNTEMEKEWREKNKGCVFQKRNCQIQISVSADLGVRMKYECRKAERGEVQGKGRSATLLEKNEEANK